MMQHLTFHEFEAIAKDAHRVAVFKEVPAKGLTPVEIYYRLNKSLREEGMIFEDLYERASDRYSFLCFGLLKSLEIAKNHSPDPLSALRTQQAKMRCGTKEEVAHLITNSMGFITYDAVRFFEAIPDRHPGDLKLPLMLFNFYALSLAFNHQKQTVLISHVVEVGRDMKAAYFTAQEKLAAIEALIATRTSIDEIIPEAVPSSSVEVDTSDENFMAMVTKAKEYIMRGDAFQIVLSRTFKRAYCVSPFQIYKTLRRVSPAPYLFYFPTKNTAIIGASPECLIRVENQSITVNPIAGTRKRTPELTPEIIEKDLLSDEKELAEHRMLVDLARNDVGAVSKPGTVKVQEFLKVKHYSHVSHISSTVTGQLQAKYDAFDALVAAFPAGTLSGAPKIRAMEIIDELENSRRGLYGGAICRLDALDNLDSCIAIRMANLNDGVATIRTGAGIVFDSDPDKEAQETRQKAQSLLDAIEVAHGGENAINH